MPSSHRRLVHRHAQRILSGTPRPLAPGEARLYSFYEPSLTGGLHYVKVSQTIEAPADPNDADQNPQKDAIEAIEQAFIVVAPRFSLQPGAVDSVFPTPGTQAEHTVLPHIVLTDPHLPWNRSPSAVHLPPDEDKKIDRSRTTWLALMVFSMEELRMGQPDIDDIMRYLPDDLSAKREQSETGALRMKARDTCKLNGVINTTAFGDADAKDAAEPTDVVVLPGQLFTALFTEPGGDGTKLNVASYKHMAHVRHIATDGMANAGSKDDDALFSIVISRRTGLINSDVPTLLVVHLLSLVFDKEMPVPAVNDRVAMTSLHSWTYTCLPSKNVAGTLELLTNLGKDLNVLRTGDNAKPKPFVSHDGSEDLSIADLVEARQADGYTLSRTRTATGEVTATILRGPLVPRRVERPLRDGFTMQSNYGSDLAIFDNKLGLLDTTYSNAWQLGKTLAMADEPFCAALARLRGAVHGHGLDRSKQEIHALFGDDGYGPRTKTADSMVGLVQSLCDINASLHASGGAAISLARNRWCHQDEEEISLKSIDMLSQNSPHISARISSHSDAAALMFAMSDKKGIMYNEYNIPASPDYAYIYSWILDKVHLANVPAHYLIPDPSFLLQETLRFFFIDDNWIDALIDGALSLANHWGYAPDLDKSRTAIKLAINERLRTPDESLGGWHVPMPRYGFLLRSQLLAQFPDIAVEVVFSETRSEPISKSGGKSRAQTPANTPPKQPILVQKRLAPDTMYCLFDAAPPDLCRIIFRMPPHQQCFKIGQTLTHEMLTVPWKKLYTTTERPSTAQPGDTLGSTDFDLTGKPAPVFDWKLRTLSPECFATFLVGRERKGREKEFSDEEPTSAVLGLQLNNPILELDIGDVSAKQPSEDDSVGLFQLSTPSRQEQAAPLLSLPSEYQVASEFIRRPRPPSPTQDALRYRQFCLNNPASALTLGSSSLNRQMTDSPHLMNPPQFNLNVYWVRSETRKYIPTCYSLPIDLVFSLTKNGPSMSLYPLTRIMVGVPCGEMPPNAGEDSSAKIPLLAPTADPPVPTMLSNMRLNVLKRWGADEDPDLANHIVFELVPREQPGVMVKMLEDASFRLPKALIAEYSGPYTLKASVKVLYEYLEAGVPKRSSYKDYWNVTMKSKP